MMTSNSPSAPTPSGPVPTHLFLRGTAQLKAGDLEAAKKSFRENEEVAGTTIQTLGLLQQADRAQAAGQLVDATGLYISVLNRNPGLVEAYLGLARITVTTGELAPAKLYATAATRLAPQVGLGWTLLGAVREAQGDRAGAVPLFAKGAMLGPDVYLCQINLGRALLALDRPKEALQPLTAATELEAESADAFGFLGQAQLQADHPLPALRALERAKDLDPTNVARWVALADALFQLREFPTAADLMDYALTPLGELPVLLEKAAAMMMSDAPRAIAYLERELAVAPDYEAGWMNLANLYLTTDNLDAAEKAAQTVLEKNPKNGEAWFFLGNLYGGTRQEDQAVDAYTQAMAASEGDYRPLVNLAMLHLASSSPQRQAEAVKLLERALSLAPQGEWRVHYNLALAYAHVGRSELALELTRGIQREADPGDPMVAEAKRLEANVLEGAK